jgi:hypothetical protein
MKEVFVRKGREKVQADSRQRVLLHPARLERVHNMVKQPLPVQPVHISRSRAAGPGKKTKREGGDK